MLPHPPAPPKRGHFVGRAAGLMFPYLFRVVVNKQEALLALKSYISPLPALQHRRLSSTLLCFQTAAHLGRLDRLCAGPALDRVCQADHAVGLAHAQLAQRQARVVSRLACALGRAVGARDCGESNAAGHRGRHVQPGRGRVARAKHTVVNKISRGFVTRTMILQLVTHLLKITSCADEWRISRQPQHCRPRSVPRPLWMRTSTG